MGKVFNFVRYKTQTDQGGAIHFDAMLALAQEVRPKLVLAGYSSYPRDYDYAAFRKVADDVGAMAMADISHIGGLVAAGVMRNPFDAGFDVVTTTTHKTLRGPRGGLILCRKPLAKAIDASVFPGLQGGPHMNNIAGAAIAFRKAAEPEFRLYAERVLSNALALAAGLVEGGARLVTGGTDNHLLVIDTIASFGLDGREAEEALDRIGITTNKQVIPDDPRPPLRPSGVRLGTPACTTRGMTNEDMKRLSGWMVEALRSPGDGALVERLRGEVQDLCQQHPVPTVSH
jgi:glycine hydroxymethyltransferase